MASWFNYCTSVSLVSLLPRPQGASAVSCYMFRALLKGMVSSVDIAKSTRPSEIIKFMWYDAELSGRCVSPSLQRMFSVIRNRYSATLSQ